MTAIVYSPEYRRYSFGDEHAFSPYRVDMVLDLLRELGHELPLVTPSQASRDDLLTVHDHYYVRRVEELGRGVEVEDAEDYGLGTADNPVFPDMDEAARWLVGGTLSGARLISERGEKRVLQLGGGLHHARRNAASGFCIYNDLAIAIQALADHGLWVAYLDVDVHHGDGVQQILYEDRRVLTMSFHESGHYLFPGTGHIHELGHGLGRGLKLNVPLEPFTHGESYLEVLERVVPPALTHFRPGVLVVQAGADAHADDPLADLLLTTRDYEAIFRKVLGWADEFTRGRVLFTLGGGYSFRAAPRIWTILALLLHDLPIPEEIPEAWRERWARILDGSPPGLLHDPALPERQDRAHIAGRNRQTAERLLEMASAYWF